MRWIGGDSECVGLLHIEEARKTSCHEKSRRARSRLCQGVAIATIKNGLPEGVVATFGEPSPRSTSGLV